MIWGEQWACPCGWQSLTMRQRCRNCGAERPAEAPVTDPFAVMAAVERHNLATAPMPPPLVPE